MSEEENKAIDLLKFYEGFFKNIGHEEEVKSIESIINYIEKLQKENEELNKQYDQLTQYFVKNHVAKDKIREIIEKLENEEKALRKDFEKHRVQLFELYKKVVLIEGYKKLLEEE